MEGAAIFFHLVIVPDLRKGLIQHISRNKACIETRFHITIGENIRRSPGRDTPVRIGNRRKIKSPVISPNLIVGEIRVHRNGNRRFSLPKIMEFLD